MFNQLLEFKNTKLLVQALTNKIHEMEYLQKTGQPYQYGNNEDFTIGGQQLLEFYFYDYMLLQGFPNQQSQFKKPSDIIQLRQKLINDKYLSEIAILLNIQNLLNVGNQKSLKNNPKVLSDCIKSIIGAHYYDKQNDLETLRDIIHPIVVQLLNKGEQITKTQWKYNPKSSFLEYLNSYKGELNINPKLTIEWKKDDSILNQNKSLYLISLELNNTMKIQKIGVNKRETEQNVYLEALLQLRKYHIKNYQKQNKLTNKKKEIQEKQCESDLSTSLDSTINNQDLSIYCFSEKTLDQSKISFDQQFNHILEQLANE
ncbi:unnamed protein product [Paramecium pentaurelia]|uniref:RNase III domain-containing protein n=1 Tax=Paramecium pentaurelia TaxID=43138 RepID=A0A8S1VKB0_9CILI|nr:unnamed protein product [Paramecium pentaurelia]